VLGGLAAFLALYLGFTALALKVTEGKGPVRILAFAATWCLAEWLRGHVLTGYPWDLAAYVWSFDEAMMQSVAWWGSWGLSFVTILALAMPALLLDTDRKLAVRSNAAALILLLALWGAGTLRLQNDDHTASTGVVLRIVQPDIAQDLKMQTDTRPQQIETLMRLTASLPGLDRVNAVIWPEAAVNYLLDREPGLRSMLGAALPPNGVLITGAPRGVPATGALDEVWNSLAAINSSGAILATADKFHLVPLGEYVPLREIFPFINKLTPGSMNFSPGPGPQTLKLPGLPPFGPLICYEVIFPGAVVNADDRPNWLLNVTNDGWFGTSVGPYQHFVTARFRAIEEGIPLARAANTGVSAMVDSYGHVIQQTALGTEAVFDADLPPALAPTLFARFGSAVPGAMFAMAAAVVLWRQRNT
jgi:apolipoprotein N-acyltransferase